MLFESGRITFMLANIVLVGPMGVGKTTIGRALAKALEMDFIDSDQEIEKRTGAKISWIFDIEGEKGFRKRETNMLKEIMQRRGVVLATGGGIVLKSENRAVLVKNNFVVYLRASVGKLLQRTVRDRNRPLLQVDNPRQRIEALLLERDPVYRSVADLVVSTDRKTVTHVVKSICRQLPRIAKTKFSDHIDVPYCKE